jgi:hydroxymethylpyrimidine kinase/phosphomethylpyrimidine kinase
VKTVLTIAGHDLSNGAGITKDLEVFAALGLRGLSVPTCFVVQGPKGASAVGPIPENLFSQMLARAGEDFAIRGVKIGVLPRADHAQLLLPFLSSLEDAFVVLDPVGTAKNGLRLTTNEAQQVIKERLLPRLTCVTPNLGEASQLVGREITDLAGMEGAARELVKMGAAAVVVKGGHLTGEPTDLLFDGNRVTAWEKKRVDRNVHGTGCLFSSALLSFLVLDYPIVEAFRQTERGIEKMLQESEQPLDDGYFYASPADLARCGGQSWWES